MRTLKVRFDNKKGIELSASLEMPIDENPVAYALFAHCFTCSKGLSAVVNISRMLNQKGIAVLRFDFTGLGSSGGDFADTNFSSNVEDLVSAYRYLENRYQAPQIMIGHSLGGTAALASAPAMPALRAVATIGAPADPSHVKNLFDKDIETIKRDGEAMVNIGGRPFRIKSQLLSDLEEVEVKGELSEMSKALLIMHSPQDATVGIDNARLLYECARHPKSFVTLDGADHLLTGKDDAQYAAEVVAIWASRYVEYEKEHPLKTDKQAVVKTGASGYVTEIKTGNHTFIADEPAEVGGTDGGPSPYDLLVAGLGACTSMTLRMYADRKGWDLKEVRVHLQHCKEHVKDGKDPEKPDAKIDRIERDIELAGDLDEKQRQRLLEIADKCPVHRTLHGTIVVNTRLVVSNKE